MASMSDLPVRIRVLAVDPTHFATYQLRLLQAEFPIGEIVEVDSPAEVPSTIESYAINGTRFDVLATNCYRRGILKSLRDSKVYDGDGMPRRVDFGNLDSAIDHKMDKWIPERMGKIRDELRLVMLSLREQRENKSSAALVFLCHASSDKAQVRELCDRLRRDGIQCWLDEDSLIPGQDWRHEIWRSLVACTHVLICISTASINKRGYVQKELVRALDLADEQPEGAIFLIPVRLETCEVPYRLQKFHYVDLFHPNGYSNLLRALRTSSTELQ